MNRSFSDDELLDAAEALGYVPHLKNIPHKKRVTRSRRRPAPVVPQIPPQDAEITAQSDETFAITYKAARHEGVWLEESLSDFLNQKWFDDVLRMVKGGKEASVYLCAGNEVTGKDYIAAKVYRPRRFRNLKNDWVYKEGRVNLDESGNKIKNEGMLHAISKRTEYGRELMHTSWLEHEFLTLQTLYEAGADVPKPYISGPNAILMEYFGDEVMSAPTLNDVDLSVHEAHKIFDRVMHNIDLMLSHDLIHADLSAYNILYWEGNIVLIDFPQAIRPQDNSSAYPIFARDIQRICEYFTRQGVRSNPRQIASTFWNQYHQAMTPVIDPKRLDEDRDDERDVWESLKNR